MTHSFSFHGSLTQFWEVIRTEYHRHKAILGRPPFTFEMPPPITSIDEYIPGDGDEIIIYFPNKENTVKNALVVEAALLPDEDEKEVHIIVHPQGPNHLEEPLKSAMLIWKEIKLSLRKVEAAPANLLPPNPL